jgi:hypothetical protein
MGARRNPRRQPCSQRRCFDRQSIPSSALRSAFQQRGRRGGPRRGWRPVPRLPRPPRHRPRRRSRRSAFRAPGPEGKASRRAQGRGWEACPAGAGSKQERSRPPACSKACSKDGSPPKHCLQDTASARSLSSTQSFDAPSEGALETTPPEQWPAEIREAADRRTWRSPRRRTRRRVRHRRSPRRGGIPRSTCDRWSTRE